MGSLLGARLAKTAVDLSLFSTNREHMEAIQKDGLFIEELDGTVTSHRIPCFTGLSQIPAKPDLVLVVVKTYATEAAVSSVLPLRHPSTLFLTLQNGIGNWERIAALAGEKAVLAGSTAQGATLVGPGRVRHGGNGPTYFGEPKGPASDRARALAQMLKDAGLVADTSDNVEQLIWEKLIVNVGINAITALTGIRNGVIADLPVGSVLCRSAVEEAVRVAVARGFPIQPDMADRVLGVARATARNRSSMGQDADRKKRTEIDAINGAVAGFAEELKIDAPVNRTLTALVKVMEANYLRQKEQ